jgi:micrococcal nuclease
MSFRFRRKQLILIISIVFFIINIYFSESNQSQFNITASPTASSTDQLVIDSTSNELDQPETSTLAIHTSTNSSSITFYTVSKVIDGDTLELQLGDKIEKVRLIGVNTPETVDPRRKVECFGREASDYAKKILTGQKVSLEFDPSQDQRDKYSRLLAYLYLEDGSLFNLDLIKAGYAYEYTYKKPYLYQSQFQSAEDQAQSKQLGLWSAQTCGGQK